MKTQPSRNGTVRTIAVLVCGLAVGWLAGHYTLPPTPTSGISASVCASDLIAGADNPTPASDHTQAHRPFLKVSNGSYRTPQFETPNLNDDPHAYVPNITDDNESPAADLMNPVPREPIVSSSQQEYLEWSQRIAEAEADDNPPAWEPDDSERQNLYQHDNLPPVEPWEEAETAALGDTGNTESDLEELPPFETPDPPIDQ